MSDQRFSNASLPKISKCINNNKTVSNKDFHRLFQCFNFEETANLSATPDEEPFCFGFKGFTVEDDDMHVGDGNYCDIFSGLVSKNVSLRAKHHAMSSNNM